MMNINKKLVKYNFTKGRAGQQIKYIVIHDTGNPKNGAGANNHYLYFNGGNRNASAHYFVDSKEIIQTVEDFDTSWHCGDNQKYLNGGGMLKNIAKNSNSIGIEICINADGNYNKTINDTLELVKDLMVKYNIPLNNVIRHHDVSGKMCPYTMSKNNWEAWHKFKSQLTTSNVLKINFLGQNLTIAGVFKNNTNYMYVDGKETPIRSVFEGMGLKVGWANNTIMVTR